VENRDPCGVADTRIHCEKAWVVPVGQADRTFQILSEYLKGILTVSDDSIIRAMRLIWERMKIVVEPSGAVPLAAVLEHPGSFAGRRVGLILSGGNVDLDHLPW